MPTVEHKVTFDKAFLSVRNHIERNKVAYSFSAGIVVTGITCVVLRGRYPSLSISVAPIIAPIFNNENTVNNGGHMRKLVKCLETGEIWERVGDAAEAAGKSVPAMSRHLNGHEDHVGGLHYEIIGIGTKG